MKRHKSYVALLIIIILAISYFSLGETVTAYAQAMDSTNTVNEVSDYVKRNTIILFSLIIVGIAIFGALKGWRRAIVLGCFLAFLGFVSYELFAFGRLIAPWLNSADSKFIPAIVFFVGGILYINLFHKLYTLMNDFLKKHLYK